MREGTEVESAMRRAVRRALEQHKRAGNAIAVWQDGRVVVVPAKKIRLEPEGKAEGRSHRSG